MKQSVILIMSIILPLICYVVLKQHGSLPPIIYLVGCYSWPVMYGLFWLSDNDKEQNKKNKIIIITKDKRA